MGRGKDGLVLGSALKQQQQRDCNTTSGDWEGASQDRRLVESVSSKVYSDQESSLVHLMSFLCQHLILPDYPFNSILSGKPVTTLFMLGKTCC